MFDYATHKALLCDSLGRRLTTGLFEELSDPGTLSKPVFKLSDWKKTYVNIADPTDYKAAMELIGDWEHWCLLVENPVFKKHLDEWRKEVLVKIRSEAIKELVSLSKSANGTSAAKWLAERGIEKKRAGKKDQPAEPDRSAADLKRLTAVK